jgi:K+-sensing histidine kinase KdpD
MAEGSAMSQTPGSTFPEKTKIDYVISLVVVCACTVIALLFRDRLEPTTFAMLYLLGTVIVAMRYRRSAAVVNALLSVTAFHYFCEPYQDSFVLENSNYVLTLVAMLAVALLVSTLTFKIRSQAAEVLAAQVAVESERTRNSLLSAVSHDLKTPLSSIYGSATSLLEEEDRLTKPERLELTQSIADEAERLNQVVTNLLEMTRLDEGLDINRDWQPLEEIVVSALTSTKKLLRGRIVTTNIPSDLPLIYADDVLLEQLFINLLENAAKYTPPESRIGISAVQHGQKVIIFVHDNGAGFPPGQEQRVFEKFFRGKTDGIRGAGLGLAICRAIVERHQGVISASNSSMGGATITIELPLEATPPPVQHLSESSLK